MIGFKYKPGDDAITVVARAIREYFDGDEEKIAVFPSRQMAEIVTTVFLDDTISETQTLIKQNQKVVDALAREQHDARTECMKMRSTIQRYKAQVDSLERAKEELIKSIMEHDGAKTGTVETDCALAGAKKAYDWIYQKTLDKELAAKAFNSYLIGGRYTDGEKYDEDIHVVNAQKIIRDATITRL